jgi:hypothetical protein
VSLRSRREPPPFEIGLENEQGSPLRPGNEAVAVAARRLTIWSVRRTGSRGALRFVSGAMPNVLSASVKFHQNS